jgi:hypothetical protein
MTRTQKLEFIRACLRDLALDREMALALPPFLRDLASQIESDTWMQTHNLSASSSESEPDEPASPSSQAL